VAFDFPWSAIETAETVTVVPFRNPETVHMRRVAGITHVRDPTLTTVFETGLPVTASPSLILTVNDWNVPDVADLIETKLGGDTGAREAASACITDA
jgi:hypothetical protein